MVIALEPRRPDVIPALLAPVEQFIAKNKRIKLVGKNKFMVCITPIQPWQDLQPVVGAAACQPMRWNEINFNCGSNAPVGGNVQPSGTHQADGVAVENPEALFQADRLVPLQHGLVGEDENDHLAIHWGATSCRIAADIRR